MERARRGRSAARAFEVCAGIGTEQSFFGPTEAHAETEVIGYVVSNEDFLRVLQMRVCEGLALLRNVARGVLTWIEERRSRSRESIDAGPSGAEECST